MRSLSAIGMVFVLAAVGCDDPAPVVLARLQTRVRDAGSPLVDGGEHEHEQDEAEREHDADDREHAEHDER